MNTCVFATNIHPINVSKHERLHMHTCAFVVSMAHFFVQNSHFLHQNKSKLINQSRTTDTIKPEPTIADMLQGMYMVQENVQGSLLLTSVSVGLLTCGFIMRYSRTYVVCKSVRGAIVGVRQAKSCLLVLESVDVARQRGLHPGQNLGPSTSLGA